MFRRNKQALFGLAAFLLPLLTALVVLADFGIFPFGDKSLLVADMNSEYIEYFTHLRRTLWGGGSFQRSWNMGMGLNSMGLIAFYAGSPLNLLFYLLPEHWLLEGVLALTLLKLGLSGLCFYLYAVHCHRPGQGGALALSVGWALCGYAVAYSSNIMWLDAVYCLPLVLWGVERLLKENRWGLLLGSLVWVFLSSYYTGYMIGVFSFLYFTARFWTDGKSPGKFGRKFLRFAGTAALAAGCCAFLLLPAFLNLRHGQESMWDLPLSLRLMAGPLPLLSKLLPGVYDSLTNAGMPNLYCTMLAVALHFLFYLHPRIPRREKWLWGGVEGLLLLSLSVEMLDLAWHAFEDPTWYPARYSFVVSFLLLFLALRALSAGSPGRLPLLLTGAASFLLISLLGNWGGRSVPTVSVVAGLVLTTAYLTLLLEGTRRPHLRGFSLFLVAALCVLETSMHMGITLRGIDTHHLYRTRDSYTGYRARYGDALETLPEGVYRTEVTPMRNANGGLSMDYMPVSHYSTTTHQALNRLLRLWGYNTGTINEVRYHPSAPLLDGLLGIRFLVAELPPGEGWSVYAQREDFSVFQNRYAFPLAFYADHIPGEATSGTDPFLYANLLFSWLWDDPDTVEPFARMEVIQWEAVNLLPRQAAGYRAWAREDSTSPASLTWVLRGREGHPAYALFPTALNGRFSQASAAVDGGEPVTRLAYRNNGVLPLGSGETVQVNLSAEGRSLRLDGAHFYTMNPAAALSLAEAARHYAVDWEKWRDLAVAGTISAPREGAMVTTIPYDQGWTVQIDGIKTETQPFAGVFLAVPLQAGDHRLELRYRAPGLLPGLLITLVSLALALSLLIRERTKRRLQR